MQKSPSASCLEILPAFRLLEKGNVGTFLRRLLIALALLPLPFVIRLLNYLARFAAFTNSQEPLVVGKARDAFASLFVFTETCRGGFWRRLRSRIYYSGGDRLGGAWLAGRGRVSRCSAMI